METRSDSNLRFKYFFYDPYLYYEGVYSMDGRTLVPDFEDQQEHLLDVMLSLNNSRYFREKFEAGEEEAIFEYARESKVCLESP